MTDTDSKDNIQQRLHLGVILPHTRLYGGVKRFLELGNEFVAMGHEFIVFTPDAKGPDWFDFKGRMESFDNINNHELDALWTTTVAYMPMVLESRAEHKIFYHVRLKEKVKALMKNPLVEVFTCSGNVYASDSRRYRRKLLKAFGGVNTRNYKPRKDYSFDGGDRPFIVMAYGRLAESVKGTKYVVKACERLARKCNIKLLLYDTPITERGKKKIEDFDCKVPFEFVLNHPFSDNSGLFGRADVFVSAENPKYTGWNNTVAEAMACGLPVVATTAGTADMLQDGVTGLLAERNSRSLAHAIKRYYDSEQLRRDTGMRARSRIEAFDWKILARRIVNYINAGKRQKSEEAK